MLFTQARTYRRIVRHRLAEATKDVPPDLLMTELASSAAKALADSGMGWVARRFAAYFLACQMVREADEAAGQVPANEA